MRKTLKKREMFILRRYLGTARGEDGTQNFIKWKFDTSASKWRVAHIFDRIAAVGPKSQYGDRCKWKRVAIISIYR